MEPKTYRKRVVTKAMYWAEDGETINALRDWGADVAKSDTSPIGWKISTKEGWRDLAHADGVICCGQDNDFYESDRGIFERNYEEAK